MIALRQAGFEPVVASMGTALTEQQLKELGRLTKRLWLAFDGDAAGETATLRGMELAAKQGFDVKVVALPAGIDPADDPQGFEAAARRRRAVPALPRADRARARRGPRGLVPHRQGAARRGSRLARAARRMALRERQARHDGAAAGGRFGAGIGAPLTARRSTRARSSSETRWPACSPIPALKPVLAELTPEHFYDPVHRALRAHIVDGGRARSGRGRAARRARCPRRRGGDRREHRDRAPAPSA